LKRLKLLNVMGGLQVVICTSKRDIAHVKAAKAVGVSAYLIKPLAIRTLQQRIEMLLRAIDAEPRRGAFCAAGDDRLRSPNPGAQATTRRKLG
jgi:DNA-binding NarL/FixJ family response regulator